MPISYLDLKQMVSHAASKCKHLRKYKNHRNAHLAVYSCVAPRTYSRVNHCMLVLTFSVQYKPELKRVTPLHTCSTGGVRTGGYPKAAPIPGPLGYQRGSDWDLLWSPARTALKAAPALKPGQLVSAIPGMFCLTKKVREGCDGCLAGDVVPGGGSAAVPALLLIHCCSRWLALAFVLVVGACC